MPGLQPFDPLSLVVIAALNPAVIAVAFLMGRAADEPQKIVVAAFVAALAGSALVWIAAYFRVLPARGLGGEGGIFALQVLFGAVWAAVGYRTKPRRR
jgi:hypothetical protein